MSQLGRRILIDDIGFPYQVSGRIERATRWEGVPISTSFHHPNYPERDLVAEVDYESSILIQKDTVARIA